MSHDVRTHTRNVNGKTVAVRRHTQSDDPARDQKKRHNFERRAQRERQQSDTQRLRDQQQKEALYPQPGTRASRAPGERKRRKKSGWQRAKGHARKAKRLWRRHKARAAAHGLAALGWAAGHATRRTASKARKTWKNWRKRRQRKS